jgi:hypothetical protein
MLSRTLPRLPGEGVGERIRNDKLLFLCPRILSFSRRGEGTLRLGAAVELPVQSLYTGCQSISLHNITNIQSLFAGPHRDQST